MSSPLVILRKRADEALTAYCASSGSDPDEVWTSLTAGEDAASLFTSETGRSLIDSFRNLRQEELASIAAFAR